MVLLNKREYPFIKKNFVLLLFIHTARVIETDRDTLTFVRNPIEIYIDLRLWAIWTPPRNSM